MATSGRNTVLLGDAGRKPASEMPRTGRARGAGSRQPAPAPAPVLGPFGTEREAYAASLWAKAGQDAGSIRTANLADLTAECGGAGITLSGYDERIIEWLSVAPSRCQVHHDTHAIPMGNYVIGAGNYVIVNPSELGNYVSADTLARHAKRHPEQ